MDDQPTAMGEEQDPYAFIREECIISSSQEDILENSLFAFQLPPPVPYISAASSGAGIAVSPVEVEEEEEEEEVSSAQETRKKTKGKEVVEEERGREKRKEVRDRESGRMDEQPTAIVEEHDPFDFIREECIISSSQETILATALFAFQLPPPVPFSSGASSAAGNAVSPIEVEEEEEVSSSQETTTKMIAKEVVEEERGEDRVEPNNPNENPSPPIENEALPSLHLQNDHLLVPPREEPPPPPPPSSSAQRVRKFGESNSSSSIETTELLEIVRRKGLKIPRPRWWRPEGYAKEVKDPKPKGSPKKG